MCFFMAKKTKKKASKEIDYRKKKRTRFDASKLKVEENISEGYEVDCGSLMFSHFEKELKAKFIDYPIQKKKGKQKRKKKKD
jgi:hypothetical protein